jgi:hypothetical protein
MPTTIMGKTYDSITDDLTRFIAAQPMFFVASAPLSAGGRVNVSPKGMDTLRVVSPTRVAYLDLTGSGNETAAHLLENGRITLMFCSFGDKPMILRLYGVGKAVAPDDDEFGSLAALFPTYPGVRQIIVADVSRVQTSCGFAVPRMELTGERDLLVKWAAQKGEPALADYRRQKNSRSIDDLPTPIAVAASSS